MRLGARVEGNLAGYLAGERDAVADRITAIVNAAGLQLRDELRAQVRSAFKRPSGALRVKGQNLEKAIRARTYPERLRRRKSLGPASLVWIPWEPIKIHETGGVIDGRPYLVIPTPEAGKLGLARNAEARGDFGRFSRGSRRRNAQLDEAKRRYGKTLRWVKTATGYVVGLDISTATGLGVAGRRKTFRNATGKRQRRRMVILFVLVRKVTLPKRIDIAGPEQRAIEKMYAEIAAAVGS